MSEVQGEGMVSIYTDVFLRYIVRELFVYSNVSQS